VIANEAIIAQMDASLEAIEASDDPSPSIMFSDANLDENAITKLEILSGGAGYQGCLTCYIDATDSAGTGAGWWAKYTLSGNSIDEIIIQNYGVGYTGTVTHSVINDPGTITSVATYQSQKIGNALFANLTNDGQTSIDVDDMWVSVDGDEPDKLSPDSYSAFGTFFPTETIAIVYLEGELSSTVTSLTITANGVVATESNL